MSDTYSTVLERTAPAPVVAPTSNGDHDRFAHYVPKKALEQWYMAGVKPTAICGKKWAPTGDPKAFPVCPTCKDIHGQMQPGDPDSPDYKAPE